MNIATCHPEYQATLYGMKAGLLPASAEDIAKAEGSCHSAEVPKETFTPSSASQGKEHPEYVEYCNYARSLGYTGC